MGHTWLPTRAVTMKSFVLSSLFACSLAAPTTHVNSGVPVGPLTPAFGDAVQTPKGLRSLALEGFSEDLNQDGFVDPIGQAVVAAPVAYTVPHLVSAANVGVAPVAAGRTAVAPVAYNVPSVYATAPVAVKAAEPVEVKTAPVTYTVPQVYTHAAPPGLHSCRLLCRCSCLHRAAHQDRRGCPCHPVRGRPLRSPHPLRQRHPSRCPCCSCCPRC